MNRISKYLFLVFIGICYTCNMSYACITPPVAGIVKDFEYYDYGLNEWVSGVVGVQGLGEYIDFDGLALSYDPDNAENEEEMGNGNGISSWEWSFGGSTPIAYEDFRYAGIDNVSLRVTDDDDPSATNTVYTKVYISRVDFLGIYLGDGNWDTATHYRPFNSNLPAVPIEAVSYPRTGSPDYCSFFPEYEPTWHVNPPSTTSTYVDSYYTSCFGGGLNIIYLNSFSEPGVYNVVADAGTSSDDINIVVFDGIITGIEGTNFNLLEYDVGGTFTYDVRPDTGWASEPDIVAFEIYDSSYNLVYSTTEDYEYMSTAVTSEPGFSWPGYSGYDTVYYEAVNPGKYYIYIYVEKNGYGYWSGSAEFYVYSTCLDIYNEHGGPILYDQDEVSPGSYVLVNIDDDDSANGNDNSNSVIDGESDKLDMAKMKIGFWPYNLTGLTIQLKASDASKVRVFNENGTAVTFPETISISRFSSGALYYYVEGLSEGSCEFTLEIKKDGTLIKDPAPKVKVTVKDYYNAFNKWGAWPGAQGTTSLNPTETINSSDLGLSGNVKWAVNHGGSATDGITATIVSHTPSTGDEWSQIVVRYDEQSNNNTFTQATEIKAFDTGANSKIAAVRRTIFKISYDSVNHNNPMNSIHTLTFDAGMGNNRTAGVVTPGGSITWFAAKVEVIGNISPSNIQWSSRGISFVYSDPLFTVTPNKWQFRMMRDNKYVDGVQTTTDTYRDLPFSDWVNDGGSDPGDAWYPNSTTPDIFFRRDNPGFYKLPSLKQRFYRDDFREFVEWHNGIGFSTCSPYCEWYCELTGRYDDMAAEAPNTSGAGSNAGAIPNKKPIANAGVDQTVNSSDTVTLTGQSQDADGNPSTTKDSDNDQLVDSNWLWTQTDGPTVTLLNSGVGRVVTFTAPTVGSATVLKFNLTVKDGTQSLSPAKFRPTNSESVSDEVIITVNPNP